MFIFITVVVGVCITDCFSVLFLSLGTIFSAYYNVGARCTSMYDLTLDLCYMNGMCECMMDN